MLGEDESDMVVEVGVAKDEICKAILPLPAPHRGERVLRHDFSKINYCDATLLSPLSNTDISASGAELSVAMEWCWKLSKLSFPFFSRSSVQSSTEYLVTFSCAAHQGTLSRPANPPRRSRVDT